MDTDTNPLPTVSDSITSKDEAESFTQVKSKKTQKRKREQDGAGMDTDESVATKRPQFPPISGDKLKVCTVKWRLSAAKQNSAQRGNKNVYWCSRKSPYLRR